MMKRTLVPFLMVLWIGLMPHLLFAQGTTDTTESDSTKFIIVEKEPTPLNLNAVKASIGYPQKAVKNWIEGTVIIRVLVDQEGNYEKHVVIQNASPILVEAIEEKIPELKFTPTISEGERIKIWVTIPFEFKLTREKKKRKRNH